MPELPEVETVRRVLAPQLCGLTVEEAVTGRPEVIAYPAADEFRSRMAGRTVTAVDRRGKFLIIRLDSGERAVVHLRMTGCLLLAPAELPPEKHTHVVLRLSGGRELRFCDMAPLRAPLAAARGRGRGMRPRRPGAGALRCRAVRRISERAAGLEQAGSQGVPAGPERGGGDREYLRRRDTFRRGHSPRPPGAQP